MHQLCGQTTSPFSVSAVHVLSLEWAIQDISSITIYMKDLSGQRRALRVACSRIFFKT